MSTPPEVTIGEATGAEVHLFQSVQSAHFLPDGRIVVADAGQHLIRVYGPDGEFQKQIGGSGEGPGEFQNIQGTWLTSDGRIAVWDAGNRRITTLRPDGEVVSSNRVSVGGTSRLRLGNLEVFLGSFADDDALLGSLILGGEPGTRGVVPDPVVLGRFELDGELRGQVGELRGMRRAARRTVPFSPMPHVDVAGDSIYVVDGYEAEIAVLGGRGERIRTISLPGRDVARDDAWSALEAELRRLPARPMTKLLLRNLERDRVPRDDRFPQIADLLVDDRGYIWIKVYDVPDDSIWLKPKGALWPAPGGEWRVVRPSGEPVATVSMPDDVTPLEIKGDRLLGLSRNELGVERIVVHTIER